jgi:hypothetical protein
VVLVSVLGLVGMLRLELVGVFGLGFVGVL